MSKKDLFPSRPLANPRIYAYELKGVNTHIGLLKIGYTVRNTPTRVNEQLGTAAIEPTIVLDEPAIRNDGSTFTDKDVHRYLEKKGLRNVKGEWYKCSVKDVKAALLALTTRIDNDDNRTLSFGMRPEQEAAVNKTAQYFKSYRKENPNEIPHFLWNAKMRFGKTFATYQLAKKMGWKKVLILTFKPAVQSAWEDDLKNHVDFTGWQFISRNGRSYQEADKKKPIICFGSFQDFLGKNEAGGIKLRNEWVHEINWDCIVFDEYHFGAWRENAQNLFSERSAKDKKYLAAGINYNELFEAEGKQELEEGIGQGLTYFKEDEIPITTDHFLYLSGTPFRAITSGEFIEEQIFNWTYSDEQNAKEKWEGDNNPYASLPRMVLMTYQLPEAITEVAKGGEFNEFDLNLFFQATGKGNAAKFTYEEEVQKWLNIIRGDYLGTTVDNLKLGAKKPPMPYSDTRLLEALNHTFWFLPSVASCYAMDNLLRKKQNRFFHDYHVVVAAGANAGIGVSALPPVRDAMDNPLETKTITLSCGKLTTGVSVAPWTGIFMLRNSSSPETYFQAAFRVQTPWTIKNPDSLSPNKELVIKEECYVFDFAPNRALRQLADYSCRLNIDEDSPEQKVAEFINFLPVLAYDGSTMHEVSAAGILEMAMSGTTATLLARRWESALLVNVDNATLQRLMNNEEAMKALMNIEGFRNLNQDIETIINKSDSVKNLKQKANEKELSPKEKEQLSDEEKDLKSKRKMIQEKLIKFATRIPVFMYLTDYREKTLKDVITQLEPGLFKKVTGLDVKDFNLLVSLNVFNSSLMNDAVFKFKRYEDSSLTYIGFTKHDEKDVGLWDTVASRKDYEELKARN